jgi:hypothetical protein
MKKLLKTEIPITYPNLLWRLTVPFLAFGLIGHTLDRIFEYNKLFKLSLVSVASLLVLWGFYITIKKAYKESHPRDL